MTIAQNQTLISMAFNQRGKQAYIPLSKWKTPAFAKNKRKKTKRLRPNSPDPHSALDKITEKTPNDDNVSGG